MNVQPVGSTPLSLAAPRRGQFPNLNEEGASPAAKAQDATPEAPKIEEILVTMLLKDSGVLGDGGDARTPLASQALVDHLIESGAFDLGLGIDS